MKRIEAMGDVEYCEMEFRFSFQSISLLTIQLAFCRNNVLFGLVWSEKYMQGWFALKL